MDRSIIADVPRDKYVERCKQRALDYLDRGDLKSSVSSFVNNMDARPDCELPHHLAELGRTRLEGLDRRYQVIIGPEGHYDMQEGPATASQKPITARFAAMQFAR